MTIDRRMPECPQCQSYAFSRHCKAKGCTWKRCGHCQTLYTDEPGRHLTAAQQDQFRRDQDNLLEEGP